MSKYTDWLTKKIQTLYPSAQIVVTEAPLEEAFYALVDERQYVCVAGSDDDDFHFVAADRSSFRIAFDDEYMQIIEEN